MRSDVIRDWNWADGFMPEIRRILAANAMHLFDFKVASLEADQRKATDMLITVEGTMAIAVRIRREETAYRDLTLRARRLGVAATELDKLKEGHGNFYLYGWAKAYAVPEWLMVDLAKLRASGLLTEKWRLIPNKDQSTWFIAIPHRVLARHNCLVAAHIGKAVRP